jgi:tetratricopeptide (TPR) repeat protein
MSNGRLWCGSCHDPHNEPTEPIAYYRSKCLSCHNAGFPKTHPAATSNCIGCHMPKRDAQDGGHTAFTDHRIQRRPSVQEEINDDIDISAWREPSQELRERNLGIADIEVGIERQSGAFIVRGYRMLAGVQSEFSSDPDEYGWMCTALLLGKQYSEAQKACARAFELDPKSATRETNLGQTYASAGDWDHAEFYLEDAMTKDSLNLAAATLLMDIYDKQGDEAKAAALSKKLHSLLK